MAIVTEEVAGESLLYYLDDHGALSEQQAAAVVADVAEALSYSHSMGIAHRDIKPANVLCCRRHEPAPCKVCLRRMCIVYKGEVHQAPAPCKGCAVDMIVCLGNF
jgi:serine/threonine protein kinase